MEKLLELTTSSGSSLFVEVKEAAPTTAMRGGIDGDRSIFTDTKKLENALAPLKDFSNDMINSLKQLIHAPDETVIEMGLKFSAKAGLIITSIDSEANFKISLKWKKEPANG